MAEALLRRVPGPWAAGPSREDHIATAGDASCQRGPPQENSDGSPDP